MNKYIRFNIKTFEIQGVSDVNLKHIKGHKVVYFENIDETKEIGQIKIRKTPEKYEVFYIEDELYFNSLQKTKEIYIEKSNKKGVEEVLLNKYPYYKQINNIYNLLLVLEPVLVDLTKDKTEKDKVVVKDAFDMIKDIYSVLGDYNESEVFDTSKYNNLNK